MTRARTKQASSYRLLEAGLLLLMVMLMASVTCLEAGGESGTKLTDQSEVSCMPATSAEPFVNIQTCSSIGEVVLISWNRMDCIKTANLGLQSCNLLAADQHSLTPTLTLTLTLTLTPTLTLSK